MADSLLQYAVHKHISHLNKEELQKSAYIKICSYVHFIHKDQHHILQHPR